MSSIATVIGFGNIENPERTICPHTGQQAEMLWIWTRNVIIWYWTPFQYLCISPLRANDLFQSWRGSVCQSDTTTTETASSTTATATSTTSSSSGSSSGSKDGLSGGDIAGICVGSIVGGLAIIGAAGWYMMRQKRIAAARKRYNMADSYRMSKTPSRASTQVAGS